MEIPQKYNIGITKAFILCTDRKIEKKSIGDYFTAVKEKNNMLNPSDIGVYSKKLFEQIFM